tara:strand:+ start:1379 stop:1870 length:492 start_codon:yes stop_codon:yes gene_type:complete
MFKKSIFAFLLFIPQANALNLQEHYCMAEAIYYEARNQPVIGQLAIGVVIRNRVRLPKWPSTVCGVVHEGYYYQGIPLMDRCQFSYWCDGRLEDPEHDKAWGMAESVAFLIMTENITIEGMESATHYHAKSVKPRWIVKFNRCGIIKDHIFYCPKTSRISISY